MADNPPFPGVTVLRGQADGPHVLLLAGVHGDEYEPMVAVSDLGRELPPLLKRGKVSLVAQANPGACSLGQRCGQDGLDLARVCPGKAEGSPTEQAAWQVSGLIRSADYLVDMHTGGVMYDIFPLAGYMLHNDARVLALQREMAQAFNLPVVWGTDPDPDGRTLSVARDAGIPAVYLEYGGGTGFRAGVAEAYRAGFINLLRYLGMADGAPSAIPASERYWVEDSRKDSGYLQGKMRSPAAGIFMAEARIGDRVAKGRRWGVVRDVASGRDVEVLADCDGLAFLLRNLIRVEAGDALGGILPVTGKGERVFF